MLAELKHPHESRTLAHKEAMGEHFGVLLFVSQFSIRTVYCRCAYGAVHEDLLDLSSFVYPSRLPRYKVLCMRPIRGHLARSANERVRMHHGVC